MKKLSVKTILLTGIILLVFQTSLIAQILTPVKWSFSTKQISADEVELVMIAHIDKTWHMYSQDIKSDDPDKMTPVPTSFNFEKSGSYELTGKVKEPKPIEEYDSQFEMILKYFTNEATFRQKVKILSSKDFKIKGYVEFMACDDKQCIPPAEVEFEFAIKGNPQATNETVKAEKDNVQVAPVNQTDTVTQVSEMPVDTTAGKETAEEVKAGDKHEGSLWGLFFLSFLAGLAAILTPCVFPMIPMTVTFFLKEKDKVKAKSQALIYGFSIILIYTVIGTLVAVLFGANFANFLSTHWLPNILFFLIFMFFAASFLGMFEITLPSWMINKSDAQADRGGVVGSFFMAFTLVLVSFSCTGPIVGAILVASAGGKVLMPIIGMLGFSLAFALPFTLFAFFPRWLNSMPKSGGWLNSVKVILGFIELALGLKFLSIADQTYHWGILDREIYLAFWIIIFALMGFYLLGKLKFAHDSDVKYISVPRLTMAIITFTFVLYLIPGMFGAPLKALSGYLPPQATHDFDLNKIVRDNLEVYSNPSGATSGNAEVGLCDVPKHGDILHLPHGLKGYFDYEQGLACAKQLNKPVFIDFTGHGCVNCREMEARVWSDPQVLKRLREDFVVIALYVDDKTGLPENEWITSKYDGKVKKTIGKKYADFQISRFNVNAQPYYVLLDNQGELLVSPKAYDLNVDNFVQFLDAGLKEFATRKK
ncbi:MAG: protein-disulfide reductase DsbD family protein [Chloroflexota bacterium]|nr:cytochrome c biogenesis protein CcdA [Lentimicrobium sp.]